MELQEDIIGHDVCDRNGDRLGEVRSLWVDEDRRDAEFAGFQADWTDDREVLVPLRDARLEGDRIVLPYDVAFLRAAPRFDPDHEVNDLEEARLWEYYGIQPLPRETLAEEERLGRPLEGRGEEIAEIPLREERMAVGKREVETGALRLRKVVRTETVNEPVELRREHIEIERVPPEEVRRARGELARPFEEGEMTIVEHGEEAVVGKTTDVVGGVRAEREIETREENVQGQVRREDVEIDRERGREL